MSRIISEIFGVFHSIFGAYQGYFVYYLIANPYNDTIGSRGLLIKYLSWNCLLLFFFAIVSIVYPKEVLTTKLGRAFLVFIILFYSSRAIGEIIFFYIGIYKMITLCMFFVLINIILCFLPPPVEDKMYDSQTIGGNGE